ncbi:Nn.00g047370.m01.CDS01 [Neocucurbitaria sp. VM-36]
MARNRGPKKFSFPLPRRLRTTVEDDDDDTRSIPSVPSVPEWPSRREESSTSKAHRVLGTSDVLYRSASNQAPVPPSPGFMSITVSEASFGSQLEDRNTAAVTDNADYPKRPAMSKRPSSNILGRAYSGDGRRGSDNSSVSHRLQPQTSNSTMRSHYDAKSSPLSISQQTSDSAVRDRALRRGQPPVLTDSGYDGHVVSPLSPAMLDETKRKDNRKSKPARLDLSRLFPKPRVGDGQSHANALLSPTKMVNSPAALSTTSEYFPRPMTREPTPQIGEQLKLKKTTARHQVPAITSSSSPVRKFKRDEYDNAKVHVRRPPKGVQHWFDALDEDSDEASEAARGPIYAPKAIRPNAVPKVPVRKTSLGRLHPGAAATQQAPHAHRLVPGSRKDTFAHEDLVDVTHLTSPSQFSVNSLVSNKTKESALSKSNLQDSSVLSFSSSEDEHDDTRSKARKVAVRKSLDVDDAGEVMIGQAQAFEVRPHRRPSAGMISTRSTSTTAATIEVMYTPEPPFPSYHYPRSSNYSGSRRSSHVRQPSVIPEDEDVRPRTAINMPLSPSAYSVQSARTSATEPIPRSNGSNKLMAVTAEEEALLEMMRKKRAAMGKKGGPQTNTAPVEQEKRQETPPESSQRKYRTSGFLSMEQSPVRGVEAKPTRKASAVTPTPLLLPPRGRPIRATHERDVGMSHLRDSSASDTWSDRQNSPASRASIPHHLPTPAEFSPFDLYLPSSATPTASVTSPTTTDHASPLPSPITPGLRMGETDVAVKVACSDTSNDSEEVAILDNGVIGALSNNIMSSSKPAPHDIGSHQRRRTASSDAAEVTFPAPPTSAVRDITFVPEATTSRPPSIIEPSLPRLPSRNSRRISGLTLSTTGPSRSRQNSTNSTNSRTSMYSHSSGFVVNNSVEKKTSRNISRGNSVASVNGSAKGNGTRDSISDDVLAAWNSLGGSY